MKKKKSAVSWILTWAGQKRIAYVWSVLLAIGNVIFKIFPYFIIADVVKLFLVTMELKAGTVNAIVGPSGSGKSTIAKLIASLWDVDSGSIKSGGADVKELALADFNRKIAYVAQDNYLFNETVRENIRQGNPEATDEQIIEVTKKSGCYEFIMQLEHGFDTVVGGAGGHLSGGERQRISIARAMLKDAPIVILDVN